MPRFATSDCSIATWSTSRRSSWTRTGSTSAAGTRPASSRSGEPTASTTRCGRPTRLASCSQGGPPARSAGSSRGTTEFVGPGARRGHRWPRTHPGQPLAALRRRGRAAPDLPPTRRRRHPGRWLRGGRRGGPRLRRARARGGGRRARRRGSLSRRASSMAPCARRCWPSGACRESDLGQECDPRPERGPCRHPPSGAGARCRPADPGRRRRAGAPRRPASRRLRARRRHDVVDRHGAAGRARRSGRGCATCCPPIRRTDWSCLGSGAVPLADAADSASVRRGRRHRVRASRWPTTATRRTSWRSAAPGPVLAALPDLPTDNAVPRWLAEHAGYAVADLRRRWRLGVDIDGPLDLVLLGGHWASGLAADERAVVESRLMAWRTVLADPRAEVVVAGRTSLDALAWLQRAGAARTRALIEERGLRTSEPGQRPPRERARARSSTDDGPEALGATLARLGDAAIVDTRVLLAHRLGADERDWPTAEDRFASDLLLPERIADPWLRALTRSAVAAPDPGRPRRTHARRARAAAGRAGHDERGPLQAGVRRTPPTDLADVGEDAALVARIRDEIRTTGPMPFARFMELALYDPEGGYYRAAEARPGRAGDFVTAPELHPIFGATLATGLREIWDRLGRPDPFVVREHGAGDGSARPGDPGRHRRPGLPLGHPLRARSRSTSDGWPRSRRRCEQRGTPTSSTAPAGPFNGVVLANEVLDALPVHRVRRRAARAARAGGGRRARRVLRRGRDRADDAGPRCPSRRRRRRARRRPDGRGGARGRRLDRRGDRTARARDRAAHRLRRPGRRAVRPGPASGRDAAGVRPPPGPRRSVPLRRDTRT